MKLELDLDPSVSESGLTFVTKQINKWISRLTEPRLIGDILLTGNWIFQISDWQDPTDNTILVYCLTRGREVQHRLTGHTDSVSSLAISPCGQYLASAAWDGKVGQPWLPLYSMSFSSWSNLDCVLCAFCWKLHYTAQLDETKFQKAVLR
jgi:WD40 repeat protein